MKQWMLYKFIQLLGLSNGAVVPASDTVQGNEQTLNLAVNSRFIHLICYKVKFLCLPRKQICSHLTIVPRHSLYCELLLPCDFRIISTPLSSCCAHLWPFQYCDRVNVTMWQVNGRVFYKGCILLFLLLIIPWVLFT